MIRRPDWLQILTYRPAPGPTRSNKLPVGESPQSGCRKNKPGRSCICVPRLPWGRGVPYPAVPLAFETRGAHRHLSRQRIDCRQCVRIVKRTDRCTTAVQRAVWEKKFEPDGVVRVSGQPVRRCAILDISVPPRGPPSLSTAVPFPVTEDLHHACDGTRTAGSRHAAPDRSLPEGMGRVVANANPAKGSNSSMKRTTMN